MKRYFEKDVTYTTDTFVVQADLNSAADPDYLKLYHQYPYADGMRDVSICESNAPTDAETLIQEVRDGRMRYICIGWLIFIPHFVRAAEKRGMTARQYADWIYDRCEETNRKAGYRAAWIEAYGEIGNSIAWPKGKLFTKREALDYFRSWMRDGRMNSNHWLKMVSPEAPSYYTHLLSRNKNFRELPIYYTDGTVYALHEAFHMGFPMVVFESQCGSMSDTQMGIAFVRGGAKMHDAWWGCDFSPFAPPPRVGPDGRWLAGLHNTPDHLYRSWLTAFLSGANTLLHEVSYRFFYADPAADLRIPSEFGYRAMQFYALTKSLLADRGVSRAPFGIMLEEAHGYRGSGYGEYDEAGMLASEHRDENPADRLLLWSGRTEVTREDWGVHRLLRRIWPVAPGKWADLGPGTWPDTSAGGPIDETALTPAAHLGREDVREYSRYLAANRWTDAFDVIPEESPAERIARHYSVIILAGGIRTVPATWDKLDRFLQGGGTLVAAIDHLTPAVCARLGLEHGKPWERVVVIHRTCAGKRILRHEDMLLYRGARGDSSIWATDENGNPLIVRYGRGKGELYLLLFSHGLTANATNISCAYSALIDFLHREHVGVWHNGPLCQMLVNIRESGTLVTLMNPAPVPWQGDVTVRRSGKPAIGEVRDVLTGAVFPADMLVADEAQVTARVIVAPWETRIVAFGSRPAAGAPAAESSQSKEEREAIARIRRSDPAVTLR